MIRGLPGEMALAVESELMDSDAPAGLHFLKPRFEKPVNLLFDEEFLDFVFNFRQRGRRCGRRAPGTDSRPGSRAGRRPRRTAGRRSEEHTSELQSQSNLVCRLLLEKKKFVS